MKTHFRLLSLFILLPLIVCMLLSSVAVAVPETGVVRDAYIITKSAKLFSEPTTKSKTLTTIKKGSVVDCVSVNGSFYNVSWESSGNQKSGYILKSTAKAAKVLSLPNKSTNIYKWADTRSEVISRLAEGVDIVILESRVTYYKVSFAGKSKTLIGYVLKRDVLVDNAAARTAKPASSEEPKQTVAPQPTPAPTPTPTSSFKSTPIPTPTSTFRSTPTPTSTFKSTPTPTSKSTQQSPGDTTLVWLSATGNQYHDIPNCGKMNPNKARQVTLQYALKEGYGWCSNCQPPR